MFINMVVDDVKKFKMMLVEEEDNDRKKDYAVLGMIKNCLEK